MVTVRTDRTFWQKTRHTAALVRLRPFDTSTPEGRAKERYRRAALTALAAAAAKGVTIATALVSVPLTLGYLGSERYGLWMTISSVIAMLSFADLGLGNGLLNAVATANGRDDREAARHYVSSAFFMLSSVAVVLGLSLALLYPLVAWERVFNVSSSAAVDEAGPAAAVFIACFLVNMPLGIVQRIQTGYQAGFAANLWQAVGSLLGLVGVLTAIRFQAGLPWLVLGMSGGPAAATAMNAVVEFGRLRPWLLPSPKHFKWRCGGELLGVGFAFFALQIAGTLAYASDNLIITQVMGPSAVATYAVVQRMFWVGPTLQTLFVAPLWPAYGEAKARHDVGWLSATLWRSMVASVVVCALVSLPLLVWGQRLIHLWVGTAVEPSALLLGGFAAWTLFAGYGSAASAFMNGTGFLGFQIICALLFAVSSIAVKIVLSQQIGVAGIIWATVITYSLFSAIPTAVAMPRILRRLERPTH